MAGFEEHILLHYDYDRGNYEDNDSLYTLGLGSHCDLLLHEVDEQMKYDTCKDRAVACKIHPGDNKAHRDRADKEVDGKERIDHKASLIGSLDEEKGKMPEGPDCTEDN